MSRRLSQTIRNSEKMARGEVVLDHSAVTLGWAHTLAVWLWIGWLTVYLAILCGLPVVVYQGVFAGSELARTGLLWFLGIMSVLAIVPNESKTQPQWALDLGAWMAKRSAEYFRCKVVVEDPEALKLAKPAFFVLEPHDVLPLSMIAFNENTGAMASVGHKCLGCITSICFAVPLMRSFYSWAGAVPATPKVINSMLSNGISPCLCPGGVREVGLITDRTKEINIFVKDRKGFIRIAMAHGVPIVPVFSFGLRDAYKFFLVKNSLVQWLGRKLGFQPMVFSGAYGIPFGPGASCSFVNIIGSPIPCPKKAIDKIDKVSDADVDAVHAKYIAALETLFETHKANYGYADVKLNIL